MTRKNSRRAATLHDVAAEVGVSPRTVSRVVNDEGGFSEATRDRVLAAIDSLGYRPNVLARGLITRRTGAIAFIVTDLNDPFFPEVAFGVQRAAREAKRTVLLGMNEDDPDVQRDLLDRLESHAPDGAIVFPAGERVEPLLPHLDRGVRMVVVDTLVDHPHAASLASELRSAGRIAVDRLRAGGRRRLGMLSNLHTPPSNRRREGSFIAAVGTADAMVERVPPTVDGGAVGARSLIGRIPDLDGLFAYNDLMAIGAIDAFRELGRRVPDDIAVIGCDGIEIGAHTAPRLTTIRIDRERLGREAVRMLLALAAGEPVDSPTYLPVELLERQSA